MNFTRISSNNLKNWVYSRFMSSSTIFHLSSGYGKCGVSVIRVSGPRTIEALRSVVSKDFRPKERLATLRSLYHPISKEMIDKGLILWFPAPKSFTGEDSCEFQVHGSIAVVEAMMDALANCPGLRIAQPGEFTKRAFFSGKLDLTEVEGLADLIHSETEAQRKQALLQSNGSLSRIYKNWRQKLIKCVAHMEAYIDFAEDENIEDNVIEKLKSELYSIRKEIQKHLNDQRQGEILRGGARTAIIGAPNVGKSSFLNLICQRQVSIVTPIAGTTRDIVENFYNICGYPVLFADTAGLRSHTEDLVEKEGINRAKNYIHNSDLLLLLMDASILLKEGEPTKESFEHFKLQYIQQLGVPHELLENKNLLVVVNKIDLVSFEDLQRLKRLDVALVSCTQNKVENLLHKLQIKLKDICAQPTAENPRLTNSRYRQQLNECIGHISVFLDDYESNTNTDLAIAAQKLRKSVKCIEKITGEVSTDDILDVVFRDFCIGK